MEDYRIDIGSDGLERRKWQPGRAAKGDLPWLAYWGTGMNGLKVFPYLILREPRSRLPEYGCTAPDRTNGLISPYIRTIVLICQGLPGRLQVERGNDRMNTISVVLLPTFVKRIDLHVTTHSRKIQ